MTADRPRNASVVLFEMKSLLGWVDTLRAVIILLLPLFPLLPSVLYPFAAGIGLPIAARPLQARS